MNTATSVRKGKLYDLLDPPCCPHVHCRSFASKQQQADAARAAAESERDQLAATNQQLQQEKQEVLRQLQEAHHEADLSAKQSRAQLQQYSFSQDQVDSLTLELCRLQDQLAAQAAKNAAVLGAEVSRKQQYKQQLQEQAAKLQQTEAALRTATKDVQVSRGMDLLV